MTDARPERISKYRIDGVLGQGAMGIVYLGFDESIERKVAIKTISIDSKDEKMAAEYTQRFNEEAKALAKCTHPNIVTILEFGHDEEKAYIVMEFVDGLNLGQLLNRTKGLSLMRVMNYFTQLLKALHTAHAHNIVHRDIKPDNVLLVNNKTVKLTDFGIAKSTVNDGLTQIGMTVGTPRYMAPEQLYGSEDIGPHTDVYCLFVLLYEMLAHVHDGKHYNITKIPTIPQLAKHNKFDFNTMVPECMVEFISKGLKVAHVDRYASVAEVVKALKPILQTLKKLAENHQEQSESGTSAAQAVVSGISTQGTVITQPEDELVIDEDQFNAIRNDLSELMGPMADYMITQALKYSRQHNAFIHSLAEKIENDEARQQFAARWLQE
ncbi:serine/threonine protein kinase [Marinicella sp. W31]|uniref:serine/threonine protein kinase n=1 Tax=Marinicella sp. W31 TaxID=3023713 RepID=UPI00375717D5